LRQDAPDSIDLTLASLDDPEAVVPEDHTWTASRLCWIKLSDGLPTYPRNRTATASNQS